MRAGAFFRVTWTGTGVGSAVAKRIGLFFNRCRVVVGTKTRTDPKHNISVKEPLFSFHSGRLHYIPVF